MQTPATSVLTPTPALRIVPRGPASPADDLTRASIMTALDALGQSIGLYTLTAVPVAHTAALSRTTAAGPAELTDAIRSAVRAVAERLALARRAGAAVSVRSAGHVVSASLCDRAGDSMVLVHVASPADSAAAMTDDEIRASYRLTPTEVRVARLLAAGMRNRETAAQLGISEHTARHHTEHVLRKLGVNRRVDVARKLQARS